MFSLILSFFICTMQWIPHEVVEKYREDRLYKADSTVSEVEKLWPSYLIRIFVMINIFPGRSASNLRCWLLLLICGRSSRGIRWLIFSVKNTNNLLIHFSLRIESDFLSDLSSPDTDSHCVCGLTGWSVKMDWAQ